MNTFPSRISRQSTNDDQRERLPGFRSGTVRSDSVIEEEIWNGILKDRDLGPRYQENIAVDVEYGRVWLRGHVLKAWHSHLITNIAGRVQGTVLVKNELISDNILQEQVVRALLRDETTSPYIFQVKSSFGWISLRGLVPSHEIARAAEVVTGFVPSVRGVISLPAVLGAAGLAAEDIEPFRRTLQPRITAGVYQDGGSSKPEEAGMVSQVIMDPCSRLVSAIAVKLCPRDDNSETDERLVPMTAVEAVNERRVWLKEGETVEAYPRFERRQFPTPAPNWRPPFPYLAGMVRWNL